METHDDLPRGLTDLRERIVSCDAFTPAERNFILDRLGGTYLVWSHEHGAWWRPGGQGYTKGLREAGHFSRDHALNICRNAIPTAMHIGAVAEVPVRLDDMRAFLDGQMVPQAIMEHVYR